MVKSMVIIIFVALVCILTLTSALPVGSFSVSNPYSLAGQEVQTLDETEYLSELQLAEDDALFETELMVDTEEDYDFTSMNIWDAYLAITEDESLWR